MRCASESHCHRFAANRQETLFPLIMEVTRPMFQRRSLHERSEHRDASSSWKDIAQSVRKNRRLKSLLEVSTCVRIKRALPTQVTIEVVSLFPVCTHQAHLALSHTGDNRGRLFIPGVFSPSALFGLFHAGDKRVGFMIHGVHAPCTL